jgi:hypothetical protein
MIDTPYTGGYVQSPYGQLFEVPPLAPEPVGQVVPLQAAAHDRAISALLRHEDAVTTSKLYSPDGVRQHVAQLRAGYAQQLDAIAATHFGDWRLRPNEFTSARLDALTRETVDGLPWRPQFFPSERDRVRAEEVRNVLRRTPEKAQGLIWAWAERNTPADHFNLFAASDTPLPEEFISAKEWEGMEQKWIAAHWPEALPTLEGWKQAIQRVELNRMNAEKWLTDAERRPLWTRLRA